MSKGGFKAFRGDAATAEQYLLGHDARRLDDYYAEGEAERVVQYGVLTDSGLVEDTLSPERFRDWMQHRDPKTGVQRGSFRQRKDKDSAGVETVGGTPLFQETVISSSKSLSLAAASDPRIGAALEAAQERAVIAAMKALKEHAVTKVGDIGKQRQVHAEQMEFTSVQHKTSRADDPHYHRHVQILPKVFAEGKWRALDGRVLYRMAERVHAAADLAVSTDVELRTAIAERGYTWRPGDGGGEVAEFEPLVNQFSKRRDQIASNRESLETEWRARHPGQQPGPAQQRAWDQLGWAQNRPEKSRSSDVATIDAEDLAAAIPVPDPTNLSHQVAGQIASQIDAEAIAEGALADLEVSKSAWSSAELKAAIDRRIAGTYVLGDDFVSLRERALEAAGAELVTLVHDANGVEGVRNLTSKGVLATDREIADRLAARSAQVGQDAEIVAERDGFTLAGEQVASAEKIAGTHPLVVVQGAAGAGKTTVLEAASEAVKESGRRLVAISPSRRGALEAAESIKSQGMSVHEMLYRAGATVDEHTGKWVLPEPDEWKPQPEHFKMDADTVLVVDEAGMLDLETARAMHRYIDDAGVGSLVLTGDASQLAPVGRGGYLARAATLAEQSLDLRDVRRFRMPDGISVDEEYARASIKLREREQVDEFYDLLTKHGQVRTGTPEEVIGRVSEMLYMEERTGLQSTIGIASTNATAQQINFAVYERLREDGVIRGREVEGRDGDPIAAGCKVATRQNDKVLGVANRQQWDVKRVCSDGTVIVADPKTGHHHNLDAEYVQENLQLAYAVTAHGSQGMTVDNAHLVLSDEIDAAGTYVGVTRGRYSNTVHAVAVDEADARDQFRDAMSRESKDLGLTGARKQVEQDLRGLETPAQQQAREALTPSSPPPSSLPPAAAGVGASESGVGVRKAEQTTPEAPAAQQQLSKERRAFRENIQRRRGIPAEKSVDGPARKSRFRENVEARRGRGRDRGMDGR